MRVGTITILFFWLGADRGRWEKVVDRVPRLSHFRPSLSHVRDSVQPDSPPVMLEVAENAGTVDRHAGAQNLRYGNLPRPCYIRLSVPFPSLDSL